MDVLNKKLNAIEIKINAFRLEIISLNDEVARRIKAGADQMAEDFLALKLNLLSKKFELAQLKSEKKLLEMQHNEAA